MGIGNDLWELFFPRCCLLCGKRLLKGEEHLCLACFSGLPFTKIYTEADNEMEKNLLGKMPLERAGAYLYYVKGGDVSRLLFQLKYYGNSDLGCYLGRCMGISLLPSGFFQGIDCIVAVPLHARKKKKRGYNQSEKLAEGISSVTGIPVVSYLLAKQVETETQTHKGNYERWMNVKNVFECVLPKQLEGKHVLLVDDVFTTGATVVACSDAFQHVPGLRISVLTLALAGRS